jgi:DNA-binding CsgD family transcriptional regulator
MKKIRVLINEHHTFFRSSLAQWDQPTGRAVLFSRGRMVVRSSEGVRALSRMEIGKHLSLGPKTVETYREHLKDKLALADAPALLRAATLWVESGRLENEGPTKPRQKR